MWTRTAIEEDLDYKNYPNTISDDPKDWISFIQNSWVPGTHIFLMLFNNESGVFFVVPEKEAAPFAGLYEWDAPYSEQEKADLLKAHQQPETGETPF